jgi:hemerythrin-like domain-containing protein
MENKPIKRSKHIVPLSHDHHSGLLFCWKIKEGLKKGADLSRIKKYINFYLEQHLKEHFLEEEALLFNQLDDELTRQGKNEHSMLIERMRRLNNHEGITSQDYLSFAELLIKHIRFEERVLFPHLEAELPATTLASVGAYLEQHHLNPFKDDYKDEFWVTEKA